MSTGGWSALLRVVELLKYLFFRVCFIFAIFRNLTSITKINNYKNFRACFGCNHQQIKIPKINETIAVCGKEFALS